MKIFYGWRMVGAAFGIQLLLGTLLLQSFGLYIAILSQEMGWSKTTLSGAAALQSMESAVIGPLLGWMLDRYRPQSIIRWGIVIFSLGLFTLSRVESVSTFYVSAVLMAMGASLGGYFPLSVTLVQWFEKNRARALSIMSMGYAMGGMLVPAMAWLIEHWGWRNTATLSGVLALVLGLPLSRVIRRRPEDHGEHMDGLDPALNLAPPASGSALPLVQAQFTLRQALRTRSFWLLAIGHGLALLVVTAVNVHAITHMKEGLGYSFAAASFVIMLMNFGQFLGVLLGAAIGNKFEMRKVTALCMLSHALGMLALTYASGMAGMIAFAALHGLAWGLRGPFMSAIRADYFGRDAIGFILGISAVITAVGQVSGPMVAGVLADLTGDYRLGFTLLAVLSALGSLAFMLATRPEQEVAAQPPVS